MAKICGLAINKSLLRHSKARAADKQSAEGLKCYFIKDSSAPVLGCLDRLHFKLLGHCIRDSLWKQVIVGKYGEEEESWCPRVKEGYEWECGRQLAVVGKFSRELFLELFSIASSKDVRVAKKSWLPSMISFFAWEAMWDRILTLYQLKKKDKARVPIEDCSLSIFDLVEWQLNDWEVDIVEWFFLRLQEWRMFRDEEDTLVWTWVKN
ncbi:hypothetical protein CK203_004391 [Vitis vinifera]|uniref:Reverse transcriptase zinc-binding domain-containing protein n=1 Tax=Vitis vinifera TaxID=29760 RepID=A0A438K9I7_VITVI|nr:hypothetical protein CK203_004391 [Vitis vinifera]